VTYDEERLDLVDPERMFYEEIKAAAGIDGDDDVSCCSSISSTGKSLSSDTRFRVSIDPILGKFPSEMAYKVATDEHADEEEDPTDADADADEDSDQACATIDANEDEDSDQACATTDEKTDEQEDPTDTDEESDQACGGSVKSECGGSVKSEKSARFNEALNTIEYIPSNLTSIHEKKKGRDDEDFPDHLSEGGKVNVWRSNMHLLDHHRFDFRVLGTSMNDETTKPHVLTVSMMDALQDYLPYTKQGEMFWLKYSMVRDGASAQSMLSKSKGSEYTVLAIETLDGEVFGAFTASPWRLTWKFYGTRDSFLWRLRRRRTGKAETRAQEALLETDIEVFPFAGNNRNVQLCNTSCIAVGGGSPGNSTDPVNDKLAHIKLTEWGFGLAFGSDLQQGTSSPCITFESPSLSQAHPDGSVFEVANMEIWTFTPCINIRDAERMEESKIVFERCMTI
jgi:hypothetical protein